MRSVSSPRAVSMMIGTLRVSWRPRRRRQTSMPESCGSIQSSSTRSGFSSAGDEQRLLAVPRLEHAIAFAFEVVAQQRDEGALVLGDQNAGFHAHAFLSKGTLVSLVVSALGRSLARWSPRHHVIDDLGDVGGVVAGALDVLGDEQKMRAGADRARIFHHVGEKFAEQAVVESRRSRRPGATPLRRLRRRGRNRRRARASTGPAPACPCARARRSGGSAARGSARWRAWRCSWRDRRCARVRWRS